MKLPAPPVLLFLCGMFSLPMALADSGIQLDTPKGGWRTRAMDGEQYIQEVNYPASSVNTPQGQADTARIRGQIKGLSLIHI